MLGDRVPRGGGRLWPIGWSYGGDFYGNGLVEGSSCISHFQRLF